MNTKNPNCINIQAVSSMCRTKGCFFKVILLFLKDSRDIILEQTRDGALNRAALVIQTFMKGCKDRCRTLERTQHRACTLKSASS